MNKKHIALLVVMVLLSIVLVIGGTYAFYIANITGNDTAEDITIASGYLELTFAEDDNNIVMENAFPNSKGSKTFTVTNTSTATSPFTYNIKLAEVETDFEQKDLVYTLEEYEDDTYETPKGDGTTATGYINADTINEEGEMYLAININAPVKGSKQYYKLTIEFKETNENQDYNKGKSFTGKINGDDNKDAKLYEEVISSLLQVCNSNDPLNECLAKGEQLVNVYADDPDSNIRYVGEDPSNYIWFNCDNYSDVTNASSAETQQCEKWRIIGLFNNIQKTAGGTEDLVKIIRYESVGKISWDSNTNSNNWTNASLKTSLNDYYYNGTKLSSAKGITGTTQGMIEQVIWNIGGAADHGMWYGNVQEFYEEERGTLTYQNIAPYTWSGRIALMYVSDYGYATSGLKDDPTYNREKCLSKRMDDWKDELNYTYKTNCAQKSWLFDSNASQFTLSTPSTDDFDVFTINDKGFVNGSYNAIHQHEVRPALYLKSNVQIIGGEGTSTEPYIIKQ